MTSQREPVTDAGGRSVAGRPEGDLDILRLALRGLPAPQREALMLASVQRLDVHAISGRLGIDVTAARRALRDGLTSLRAVLDVVEPADAGSAPHVPDA